MTPKCPFIPVVVEGEHRNPGAGGVELQDSLAEVVLRSQAVGVELLHIQAVTVGVGLLHNQGWDHHQDSPAAEVVELPHILDQEVLLAVQDVGLLDSPEVGLLAGQGVGLLDSPVVELQGIPVVGVLHLQGMADQGLLAEEPWSQDMLHQGSLTSVKLPVFL